MSIASAAGTPASIAGAAAVDDALAPPAAAAGSAFSRRGSHASDDAIETADTRKIARGAPTLIANQR
jgi:hypothetical protein